MAAFQVDGSCYNGAVNAVQAMAAREVGKVVSIGAKTYVVDVTAVTGSSITYKFNDVSSTAFVSKVATVSPLACGLLETADGLVIAWGIATAWLVTAGILFLRRGIHTS